MVDYDKDIILTFPFTKGQLNYLGINDSSEMNGIYIYNTKKAYINVGSQDFEDLQDADEIIDLFIKVDTHETVHACIHDILGHDVSTPAEERAVLLLDGRGKWRRKLIK